jgi:NADH pyrophosphatase NudC (nudix superfamily)
MPPFSFCPACGAPLTIDPARPQAPQRCAARGATHYHNSKPCAGALILRGDELPLAERAVEPFRGYWDILPSPTRGSCSGGWPRAANLMLASPDS